MIENSFRIKVEIYCNRCQEYFWQIAKTHINQKRGHSRCKYERTKQTNLLNNFILRLKKKSFIFPSGKEVFVQGYEPFALKRLVEEEKTENIITDRTQVPPIQWTDSEEKTHIYFVDIFIPSQNHCIEVKSLWTYHLPMSKRKEKRH